MFKPVAWNVVGKMLGLKSNPPGPEGRASSTPGGIVNVPALAKTTQLKLAPLVLVLSVALSPSISI